MSVIRTYVICAAVGLCLAGGGLEAKQFQATRAVEPGTGLRLVTVNAGSGNGDSPEESVSSALRVGRPAAIAKCDTWITSDYEIDLFTSNYLWCDFENLQIVGGFFSPHDATVHASVVVRNGAGVEFYAAEGIFSVDPSTINYIIADVGPLPPGFYQVLNKLKQGRKAVGQKFWLQVTDETDPLCTPYGP